MSITSVASVRAALTAGALQTLSGARVSAGTGLTSINATGTGSTTGPAAVAAGSTPNFAEGLYNSLGTLLNGGAAVGVPAIRAASSEKRTQGLQAAAEKIGDGDTAGGRAVAEALLAKNADDVEALRLVAASYLFEGEYKKAEGLYQRALALNPDDSRVQDDITVTRALQKSDDEVLADARQRVGSSSHRDTGLRLLQHLANRSPDDAEAFLVMADAFTFAHRPDLVVGALEKALAVGDDAQTEEVAVRAERLVKEHPQVGMLRNLLGRALQESGRLDEAVVELTTASDAEPCNLAYAKDLAVAYATRSLGRLALGNTSGARMDVSTAKTIAPLDPVVAEATARVAAEGAKKDLAGRHYNQALTKLAIAKYKSPDDAAFKKELAGLFVRAAAHFTGAGDDAWALSAYESAYELDPTSPNTRRKVAELSYTQGLAAVTAKNYDRAVTLLRQAYDTYRLTPGYGQQLANAYDLRGQLRQSLNEPELALEDYKSGLHIDPTNASLAANYASLMGL